MTVYKAVDSLPLSDSHNPAGDDSVKARSMIPVLIVAAGADTGRADWQRSDWVAICK